MISIPTVPTLKLIREYRETYARASTARNLHKQYDMYKRFIRWASDRLDDDGIIAFITNRSFLDARQDDGFRQVAGQEFTDIYVLDLGSDVRRNPKISGTTHNVFGIQTGVAIGFFVREKSKLGQCGLHYVRREDAELAKDKLVYLQGASLEDIEFEGIAPDAKNNWLNQSNSDFEQLMTLVDQQSLNSAHEEVKGLFALHPPGVVTARDEWVYDLSESNVKKKARFFATTYNGFLDHSDNSFDPVIKWSRNLRRHFQGGRRIEFEEQKVISSLYRPFATRWYFADPVMSNDLTKNQYEMFGSDLRQTNKVINVCINGKSSYLLTADKLTDFHFTGDSRCLPLYRYTEDGKRVSNITEWGLRQFREHYGDESISAEDIFAYTYSVLHDPAYREKYAIDLLREFPSLPYYEDFQTWAHIGQELLDLHIGFESEEPYRLKREDSKAAPGKARLKADKERGLIVLDNKTTLSGVPEIAWKYRLGSRSAIEWVLDQYKERKPKDPTIASPLQHLPLR